MNEILPVIHLVLSSSWPRIVHQVEQLRDDDPAIGHRLDSILVELGEMHDLIARTARDI